MKRLFLISLLVFVVASLSAQEKGKVMISGSVSYNSASSKVKDGDQSEVTKGVSNFLIMPEFHIFLSDKLSVGLGLGYSLDKTPNSNAGSNDDQLFDKMGLFMIQPMVNYYVSLGNNFYYVPRFYVGYGIGKYKEELTNNKTEDTDVSAFELGLSVLSFEFKPTNRIGIRFNAGDLKYQNTKVDLGDDANATDRKFNFGLNLGATVGFNFYF